MNVLVTSADKLPTCRLWKFINEFLWVCDRMEASMECNKLLGQKIRDARKKLNLCQDDLAGDIFTKSYISKIEKGMVNPSMKALEIIASRLNMPVAYFLTEGPCELYDPKQFIEAQRLYDRGKYKESLLKFSEIANNSKNISNDLLLRVYYFISDINYKLENYDDCILYCQDALNLADNVENIYIVKLYLLLGDSYYCQNRRQDSLDIFLNAERLIKDLEIEIDIIVRLELYNDIGILYSQLGNTQLSIEYFKTVIGLSKKSKVITRTVLSAFAELAQISTIYERDADKSLSYLNSDVLSLYKYFEDYSNLGRIYLKYSNAYYEKDDLNMFNEYVNKTEELLPLISDEKNRFELKIYVTLYKGKLLNSEGKYEQAERLIFEALDMSERHDDLILRTAVYLNLGVLFYNTDRLNEALDYLKKCKSLSSEIQYSLRLPELYQYMGKVYIKMGDVQNGQEYYDRAFKLLKEN